MREQVIDIFSEWLAYYIHHREECADSNACRQWVNNNYPDAPDEIVQAVVDSYDQKPDAICSWEFTKDKVLNIIIRKEKR